MTRPTLRLGAARIALAAALTLPCAALAAGTAPAPAATARGLEWVDKYEDALSRAKSERKLVLLDFYTDWCGWCKRLDKDVFAVPAFQTAASGVLGVRINAEKLPELAQRYGVSSYPRLFILDSSGAIVERIRGYLNLTDFTAKIEQVKRGDTEFNRFRDAASDPTNLPAIHRFARLLSDGNQKEQSISYWQQVHDLTLQQIFANPQAAGALNLHRESLVELGKGYATVGLDDVARQHFDETVKTYPGTPHAAEALVGLAEIEMKAKGCGRSLALLEQVMREHPGTPAMRQAHALTPKAKACTQGAAR